MANVTITDLTAYADPVSTDVLPIVDVGTNVTKKVSIAAPVGSLYLRADGTPNNTLYVKESGSGNSGWGAVPTQALLVN